MRKLKRTIRIKYAVAFGVGAALVTFSNAFAQEERSEAIEALDFYIDGQWKAAERMQTSTGASFPVVFDVNWFDQSHTIARMNVARYTEDSNGSNMIEGYYFWNPETHKATYQSYVFDGRYNKGTISIDDSGKMVIDFSSFDVSGRVSKMKIERTIVGENQFDERVAINIKGQWQTLAEGKWLRIAD